MQLMRLFFTPDDELYDLTIDDVLDEEFYKSNFWLYWQTMFAFEKWHSALEMKLYLQRFLHHIGGLPDLSALKFTKYNQYESLILPLVSYLKEHGVQFHYNVRVTNVLFHFFPDKKVAHQLILLRDGKEKVMELTENDLVFVTNGSCTESAALGGQRPPAPACGRERRREQLVPVEAPRGTKSPLRASGEVLFRYSGHQMGVGHRHPSG